MSVATEISRLQTAKADLKTAIEAKGVVVPSSAKLDVYDDYVAAIPQGGGITPASPKDVNFFDYDGTIVYSYTRAEFLALSSMPDNPTHAGLTAQGWNWTLAQAKTYVTDYTSLGIGQMYVTDDGKNRVYVQILSEGRMTLPITWSQTAANGVTINWGDGSAEETFAGTGAHNTTHTYSAIGDYVVTLQVTSGTMQLGNGASQTNLIGSYATNAEKVYMMAVRKVEIGASTALNYNVFQNLIGIEAVTMPQSITSIWSVFANNQSLRFIVLPSGLTDLRSPFSQSDSLFGISLPYGIEIKNQGNAMAYNYSFRYITIPSSATSLNNSFCYSCYSLATITIPSGVTSIGANCFYNAVGLGKIIVKPATPPTLGSNVFTGLQADCVIYVPHGKLSDYKGASGWSAFASQMVELPE